MNLQQCLNQINVEINKMADLESKGKDLCRKFIAAERWAISVSHSFCFMNFIALQLLGSIIMLYEDCSRNQIIFCLQQQ